jgi:hypothetical protein
MIGRWRFSATGMYVFSSEHFVEANAMRLNGLHWMGYIIFSKSCKSLVQIMHANIFNS